MRSPLPIATDCTDCGACCTEQAALPVSWFVGAVPLAGPDELIPLHLHAELIAMRNHFLAVGFPPDGSPCVWYDAAKKKCRHYHHRPSLCRDAVEVGDESCQRWRLRMTDVAM